MLDILYISYFSDTPEVLSYIFSFDFSRFRLLIISPNEINFGKYIPIYEKLQREGKLKVFIVKFPVGNYSFFNLNGNREIIKDIIGSVKPKIIYIQAEITSNDVYEIVKIKNLLSLKTKIIVFAASQYLPNMRKIITERFVFIRAIRGVAYICCRNKNEVWKFKKMILFEGKKIFYNYWGVSPDDFHSNEKNKEELLKNFGLTANFKNKFIIGFSGRIVQEKGLHMILEALKQISDDYILLFAGNYSDEIYEEAIKENMAQESIKNKCFYLGDIKYQNMQQFYNLIDLLIVPTNSGKNNFQELFGRVIPEAMLCKTMVIGSNNGSIPEIINDPELIFDQTDPVKIKEKIVHISQLSSENKQEILEKNYNYAINNYTSQKHIERLQSFIYDNYKY